MQGVSRAVCVPGFDRAAAATSSGSGGKQYRQGPGVVSAKFPRQHSDRHMSAPQHPRHGQETPRAGAAGEIETKGQAV